MSDDIQRDDSITVITRSKGWVPVNWKELWHARELVYFMVLRDRKVRHRQSLLGAGWAVVRPLLQMVVLTVVFGGIANVSSLGIPYPIFSLAALVPFNLFQSVLTTSSDSLLTNSFLIAKVYFPRLIAPIASGGAYLVDFGIGMVILFGLLFYYGIDLSLRIFLVIPLALLALMAALSFGIWFSALNVRYRDIRFIVPFLVQVLFFLSPIGYSSTEVEGNSRIFFAMNPMTGVADGFRWALLGADTNPGQLLLVSTASTLVILISGLYVFKRVERSFADVI